MEKIAMPPRAGSDRELAIEAMTSELMMYEHTAVMYVLETFPAGTTIDSISEYKELQKEFMEELEHHLARKQYKAQVGEEAPDNILTEWIVAMLPKEYELNLHVLWDDDYEDVPAMSGGTVRVWKDARQVGEFLQLTYKETTDGTE